MVQIARITPENAEFILLSFEGPDLYSLAGGLGVRVTHLSCTLAEAGFGTQLFFIGDPHLPSQETRSDGRLVLRRWSQWISSYYPRGVYDGEDQKIADFNRSVPEFIVEHLVRPAVARRKIPVILAEEWQTAETVCRLHELLKQTDLRAQTLIFWNANNTYSFNRIDWQRLQNSAIITTVSRYMKHVMWGMRINPLVIPNGIPRSLLESIDDEQADRLRKSVDAEMVLCKVARWSPEKCWDAVVEATAILKEQGTRATLIARGGMEPYGEKVRDHALQLGLVIKEARPVNGSLDGYLKALQEASPADVIDVKSPLPLEFLRVVYRAADSVLANSGHEPFGIVGLETMAAGGVAFTGCTGEDYAIPFVNSIVLETSEPEEIADYALFLKVHPEESTRIRRAARESARFFTWDAAVASLIRKVENQARAQEIIAGHASPVPHPLMEIDEDLYPKKFSARPGTMRRLFKTRTRTAVQPAPDESSDPSQENQGGAMMAQATRRKATTKASEEKVPKQDVVKFLARVPDEYVFWCHDGTVFHDVKEMAEHLRTMTDETFAYHCNAAKNDFTNWVRDVIGDRKLAEGLAGVHDRMTAAQIVSQRAAFLESQL